MDVRDMSGFQSGSFDAVIDKGIIIIALLHSSMEVTANICTCIPLVLTPSVVCRNTRFYYGESFPRTPQAFPSLILNSVICISVRPKFARKCN
jgi:hypothetical protein